MMEDLLLGGPDFSWAQLFLAIDQLSRKNLITLSRMGLSYQIRTRNHAETFGQTLHDANRLLIDDGLAERTGTRIVAHQRSRNVSVSGYQGITLRSFGPSRKRTSPVQVFFSLEFM